MHCIISWHGCTQQVGSACFHWHWDTSTETATLILKSNAQTSRCGLEYWNQEQKKYNNFKRSGDANSIPIRVCCLDIPLSALSLRGIKLKTWNALAVGHQHVSTQPETQDPARLYSGSRNSNSRQELAHGHITWEDLSHIYVFFTLDWWKLKHNSGSGQTSNRSKACVAQSLGLGLTLLIPTPAAGKEGTRTEVSSFSTTNGWKSLRKKFIPLWRWCTRNPAQKVTWKEQHEKRKSKGRVTGVRLYLSWILSWNKASFF